MEPSKLDIVGELAPAEGTTWEGMMFTVAWDVNGTLTDQVPNITGVEMHIRTDYNKSPALKKLALGSGCTIVNGTPNKVKIGPILVDFAAGMHKHDVFLVFSGGERLPFFKGAFRVNPAITKNIP